MRPQLRKAGLRPGSIEEARRQISENLESRTNGYRDQYCLPREVFFLWETFGDIVNRHIEEVSLKTYGGDALVERHRGSCSQMSMRAASRLVNQLL